MTKPALLMTGAYPAWDLDDLKASYRVLRLWEASAPSAFLAEQGPEVRAIATRGDLGASADLMRALPKLEIVACYGVGTDAIDLACPRRRHPGDEHAGRADRGRRRHGCRPALAAARLIPRATPDSQGG